MSKPQTSPEGAELNPEVNHRADPERWNFHIL